MSRIDAHCHYWTIARGDYGWLDETLAPLHRDFGAADYAMASAGQDIGRRVLVQAAPTVAETEFLLECAAADPGVAGVVGWVDLASPGAIDDIGRLAQNPHFKGIRPMLQDIADPDWINVYPQRRAIKRLVELGLRFDALVKPAQIAAMTQFAGAYPGLPIIIDHAGKPDLAAGAPAPEWTDAMTAFAGMQNVSCKLSGLLTEMDAQDLRTPEAAAQALMPVFHDLLAWFGPSRIAWGSDWPVVNLAADYGFWCETTDRLLEPLSPTERNQILSATAARLYGLDDGKVVQ